MQHCKGPGRKVLSVFESSRSRDQFTSKCPYIVGTARSPAASSIGTLLFWTLLPHRRRVEKPLKLSTYQRGNNEGVCSVCSLVLRLSMELAIGSGQAHVVKCPRQGGSHHKGFLETPCSLLPYSQEGIWRGCTQSRLRVCWRLLKEFDRMNLCALVLRYGWWFLYQHKHSNRLPSGKNTYTT